MRGACDWCDADWNDAPVREGYSGFLGFGVADRSAK